MMFLSMNISAAFMILVIFLIRKLFLYKIPQQIFGVLWGLVIIRLYIPYNIETDFNFYNGIYYIREMIAKNDWLNIGQDGYYFDRTIYSYLQAPNVKWLLIIVWIIGLLFMMQFFIKDYIKTRQLLRKSMKSRLCEQASQFLHEKGLKRKFEILQSDEIDMPMACGFLHPKILLPPAFERNPVIVYEQVLIHEYMHLKYLHPLLQLILICILCVNWFNPIIWIWYQFMNRDIEIACDKHVLDLIGKEERESYALNLINMANDHNKAGAFYNGFAKNVMKERVVAIMKYKKTSIIALVISLLIPTCVASAFGTTDNYIFGDEINPEEAVVTINIPENLDKTNVIYVDYEELKPYVVEQESKASETIKIVRYKYVAEDGIIAETLNYSTTKDGYTYSGTLTLVDMEMIDSKMVGYYSGTLYRQ